MKKNHNKALLLLLTLPFLTAMYNGPHFYVHHYDSYDLDYVSHEQIDDKYVYTCDFKNNSATYLTDIKLNGTINDETYTLTLKDNSFSDIFSGYVPGPYYEGTVKLVSNKEIPDISKLKKDGNGFRTDDSSIEKAYASSDVVQGIYLLRPKNENSSYYCYRITLKPDFSDIYCCALYEMEYDEDKFYLLNDRTSDGYTFYTFQEVDLTKLKVGGITFIEEYHAFSPKGDGLLYAALVLLGIVLLIHLVIFLIVFFFIRFLIRKNRKARASISS